MPPPILILLIPSVALVFLIQMVICHAYQFQVSLAHQKSKGHPKIKMSSREDTEVLNPQDRNKNERNVQKPQDRKGQSPTGKNDEPIQRRQGRDSQGSSRAGSRDLKNPMSKEHVKFSLMDSRIGSVQYEDPYVEIPTSASEEIIPQKVDPISKFQPTSQLRSGWLVSVQIRKNWLYIEMILFQ